MDPTAPARPPPPRLTMKAFWADAAAEFLSLDSRLLYTLRGMATRPGALVRDFVQHRDPRVMRPLRWFLLALAVPALMLRGSGFDTGLVEGIALGAQVDPDSAVMAGVGWTLDQAQWLLLAGVLPATAAGLVAAYRPHRPDFAEMWVLCLYVAGLALLLGAPLLAVVLWLPAPTPLLVGLLAAVLALPVPLLVITAVGYFPGPLWPRLARALWALLHAGLRVLLFLAGATALAILVAVALS